MGDAGPEAPVDANDLDDEQLSILHSGYHYMASFNQTPIRAIYGELETTNPAIISSTTSWHHEAHRLIVGPTQQNYSEVGWIVNPGPPNYVHTPTVFTYHPQQGTYFNQHPEYDIEPGNWYYYSIGHDENQPGWWHNFIYHDEGSGYWDWRYLWSYNLGVTSTSSDAGIDIRSDTGQHWTINAGIDDLHLARAGTYTWSLWDQSFNTTPVQYWPIYWVGYYNMFWSSRAYKCPPYYPYQGVSC